MLLSLIFGLIIGAASVVFALQNMFPVTVVFFVWKATSSLAIIVSLATLAGILISALLSIPEAIKNSFVIFDLKKENKKLVDELEASRQIQNQIHIITPKDTIMVEKESVMF
jgi:uncharacterized integral membrane protein